MYRDPFEHHFEDIEGPQPVVFYETPKAVLTAGPGEVLITLSKGFTALLDEDDIEVMQGRKFCASKARSNWYARNVGLGYLHRLITKAEPGWVVDHKNRNSLDCRRHNLKICGFAENAQNADYELSKTGYRGVYRRGNGKFYAQLRLDGERCYLGTYITPLEAAAAYDEAALKFYGPFAWTNFDYDETPKLASCGTSAIPF